MILHIQGSYMVKVIYSDYKLVLINKLSYNCLVLNFQFVFNKHSIRKKIYSVSTTLLLELFFSPYFLSLTSKSSSPETCYQTLSIYHFYVVYSLHYDDVNNSCNTNSTLMYNTRAKYLT